MVNNAHNLFAKARQSSGDGTDSEEGPTMMSWEEFERQLHAPEMIEYFKSIDVDLSEARELFDLIDLDGTGMINSQEFLSGVVRLHGPAKALDVAVLMHEVKDLSVWFQAHLHFIEDCLVHVSANTQHAEMLLNMKYRDQKALEARALKEKEVEASRAKKSVDLSSSINPAKFINGLVKANHPAGSNSGMVTS